MRILAGLSIHGLQPVSVISQVVEEGKLKFVYRMRPEFAFTKRSFLSTVISSGFRLNDFADQHMTRTSSWSGRARYY